MHVRCVTLIDISIISDIVKINYRFFLITALQDCLTKSSNHTESLSKPVFDSNLTSKALDDLFLISEKFPCIAYIIGFHIIMVREFV